MRGSSAARTVCRRLIRQKTSRPGLQGYEKAEGDEPAELPRVAAPAACKPAPRDVFAYVIHEGKIRAPAGAMALIEAVGAK